MADRTYYMWGFEENFQIAAYVEAKQIFESLDPALSPQLFLVGILDSDLPKHYPACVVSQDETLKHAAFMGVKDVAERLEQSDPRQGVIYTDERSEGQRQEGIRRNAIMKAIREVVTNHPGSEEFLTFCSWPTTVAGYLVVAVLQLPRAAYEAYYRLQKEFTEDRPSQRLRLMRSFLECVVDAFLEAVAEHMTKPEPGSSFVTTADKDQVLRRAARSLMYTPAHAGGNFLGTHGLDMACTNISTLRYEGKEGVGGLVLAKPGHPDIETDLMFVSPVNLHDYGAVRKLLQLTGRELSLLCDSYQIYGLGRQLDTYDPTREDLFVVRFLRQFSWELRHAGQPLMSVRYGQPHLRLQGFPQDRFRTDLPRVFPNLSPDGAQRLFSLAKGAAAQSHGCMLVITAVAAEEAERLSNQGTQVKPVRLDQRMLPLVTAIDGAVLVDLEGNCHAIGVILDGLANAKCSPSRGARYNSAVRYVHERQQCMILVKSEDGMVSVFPELRPQIRRIAILDAIAEVRTFADLNPCDQRDLLKAMNWFEKHEFYLSPEQCDEVNKLRRSAAEKTDAHGGVSYQHADLKPNPEMNDSYLIN